MVVVASRTMKIGMAGKAAMVALATVVGLGPVAFGQAGNGQGEKKAEALRPPTPAKPDDPPLAMNYVTMALLIGLLAGAALIPSKRGHQD